MRDRRSICPASVILDEIHLTSSGFADSAAHAVVITTWFNGLPMPSIVVCRVDGSVEVVREFVFEDFRSSVG